LTLVLGSVARADVVISNDPTQNMTCSGGVCSPTAASAVLSVTDLANMLAGVAGIGLARINDILIVRRVWLAESDSKGGW
jgi:hypothetical protein